MHALMHLNHRGPTANCMVVAADMLYALIKKADKAAWATPCTCERKRAKKVEIKQEKKA